MVHRKVGIGRWKSGMPLHVEPLAWCDTLPQARSILDSRNPDTFLIYGVQTPKGTAIDFHTWRDCFVARPEDEDLDWGPPYCHSCGGSHDPHHGADVSYLGRCVRCGRPDLFCMECIEARADQICPGCERIFVPAKDDPTDEPWHFCSDLCEARERGEA